MRMLCALEFRGIPHLLDCRSNRPSKGPSILRMVSGRGDAESLHLIKQRGALQPESHGGTAWTTQFPIGPLQFVMAGRNREYQKNSPMLYAPEGIAAQQRRNSGVGVIAESTSANAEVLTESFRAHP